VCGVDDVSECVILRAFKKATKRIYYIYVGFKPANDAFGPKPVASQGLNTNTFTAFISDALQA